MMLLPLDRSCYRSIFSVQVKALRRYKETKVTLSIEPTAKMWGGNLLAKNLFLSQTRIFSCTFSCQIATTLYKFHFTKLRLRKILHQVRYEVGKRRGWRVNRSECLKTGWNDPTRIKSRRAKKGKTAWVKCVPARVHCGYCCCVTALF